MIIYIYVCVCIYNAEYIYMCSINLYLNIIYTCIYNILYIKKIWTLYIFRAEYILQQWSVCVCVYTFQSWSIYSEHMKYIYFMAEVYIQLWNKCLNVKSHLWVGETSCTEAGRRVCLNNSNAVTHQCFHNTLLPGTHVYLEPDDKGLCEPSPRCLFAFKKRGNCSQLTQLSCLCFWE